MPLARPTHLPPPLNLLGPGQAAACAHVRTAVPCCMATHRPPHAPHATPHAACHPPPPPCHRTLTRWEFVATGVTWRWADTVPYTHLHCLPLFAFAVWRVKRARSFSTHAIQPQVTIPTGAPVQCAIEGGDAVLSFVPTTLRCAVVRDCPFRILCYTHTVTHLLYLKVHCVAWCGHITLTHTCGHETYACELLRRDAGRRYLCAHTCPFPAPASHLPATPTTYTRALPPSCTVSLDTIISPTPTSRLMGLGRVVFPSGFGRFILIIAEATH